METISSILVNKLLPILLISSICLSQEMEVDGNLTVADTLHVTTIQSATLDSLLSLIAQLEMRIAQLECQNTGIIPDGYCDCFFHTLDECGVCNGDTTSCQDCAGVPNGDSLQDMCGYCDNDSSNDCVQDCNGEWGGTAVEDVCGICGGTCDTWCGCDSICEAVEDVCGDCGGETTNEDDCVLTDIDGNTYETVEIGEQVWMAENIRSSSGRRCYNDNPDNCEIYGGLYTWDYAQTACPSDWHLPSEEEYNELYSLYGGQGSAGSALKDDELWNGTNESGFSAVPAGYYRTVYANMNSYNFIWTSTESDDCARNIKIFEQHAITHENRCGAEKNHYFSIRCVQN